MLYYEIRIVSRTKDCYPVLAKLTFLALLAEGLVSLRSTILVTGITDVLLKETNKKWTNLSLNGFLRLRFRVLAELRIANDEVWKSERNFVQASVFLFMPVS